MATNKYDFGPDGEVTMSPKDKPRFPAAPLLSQRRALAVYPLTKRREFYMFQAQQLMSLNPVYPVLEEPKGGRDLEAYRHAAADIQKSCTNNPARQFELTGMTVSECNVAKDSMAGRPKKNRPAKLVDTMHILTTGNRSSEPKSVAELGLTTIRVPLNVNEASPVGDLSRNEVAYLRGVAAVLTKARANKLDFVFIADPDVVLHCNFQHQLQAILASPRCGKHLFTRLRGGVLLLGAQEWTPEAHARISNETTFRDGIDRSTTLCYNPTSETSGTFAAVYHKITFDPLLRWISNNLRSAQPEPFDRSMMFLSDLGYIVRAANPPLVIQDTTKPSRFSPGQARGQPQAASAVSRADQHHWDTNQYCYYTEFV